MLSILDRRPEVFAFAEEFLSGKIEDVDLVMVRELIFNGSDFRNLSFTYGFPYSAVADLAHKGVFKILRLYRSRYGFSNIGLIGFSHELKFSQDVMLWLNAYGFRSIPEVSCF